MPSSTGTRKRFDDLIAMLTKLRDQLRQNVLVKQYYCDIDIAHLISYNEELAHKLTTEPADIIPLVSSLPWLTGEDLLTYNNSV
jgi:DNA replicative helicase MCM subunit Mcm2 (Cdc46/Mcm family)